MVLCEYIEKEGITMEKKKKPVPNFNPNPPAAKAVHPPITSFLDIMKEGNE